MARAGLPLPLKLKLFDFQNPQGGTDLQYRTRRSLVLLFEQSMCGVAVVLEMTRSYKDVFFSDRKPVHMSLWVRACIRA